MSLSLTGIKLIKSMVKFFKILRIAQFLFHGIVSVKAENNDIAVGFSGDDNGFPVIRNKVTVFFQIISHGCVIYSQHTINPFFLTPFQHLSNPFRIVFYVQLIVRKRGQNVNRNTQTELEMP